MKRYICALCVMLSFALCLTSCLGDDDTNVTYSDDMVITSFALTAVNRYDTKTTSAGKDTTTITKLSSGLPVFTIDQYKNQIYNTEPLPAGCDLKHLLANISGKGTILLKSMVSDSLFYYSSTDSIDFSQTRDICVYALDGSGYRIYQVTVNKMESEDEDFHWSEYAAGSPEIPAALYQTFALQKSEGNGFQLSKDGGNTWSDEQLGDDENPSLLPESDIAWLSFPYSANKNTDYEIMAGSLSSDDTACTVWRKIVEKSEGAAPARWVNIPVADSKEYYLPKMSPLSLIWFDNAIYAIGNTGIFYKSRDGGITWKESDDISLPDGLESNNVKAITAEDGSIWLMDADSGRAWRGGK